MFLLKIKALRFARLYISVKQLSFTEAKMDYGKLPPL